MGICYFYIESNQIKNCGKTSFYTLKVVLEFISLCSKITKNEPQLLKVGGKQGGEVKEKYVLFRTPGALGLQMDARSAQSHQNGAQSPKIAPKWEPKTSKWIQNPIKNLSETCWEIGEHSVLLMTGTKKQAHRATRRNPSTHQPINQSTNQPI